LALFRDTTLHFRPKNGEIGFVWVCSDRPKRPPQVAKSLFQRALQPFRILRIGFVWSSVHTIGARLSFRLSVIARRLGTRQSRPFRIGFVFTPTRVFGPKTRQIGFVWRTGGSERQHPAIAIALPQIINNP
jgi:hypothetical protein